MALLAQKGHFMAVAAQGPAHMIMIYLVITQDLGFVSHARPQACTAMLLWDMAQ